MCIILFDEVNVFDVTIVKINLIWIWYQLLGIKCFGLGNCYDSPCLQVTCLGFDNWYGYLSRTVEV